MQYPKNKQSVLVVTGMHRSGTSLTASLLKSAGVDIGKRLMGQSCYNLKGHFENLDFVDFHESVLSSQGISKDWWTLEQRIQVQEQYLDRAKFIIRENSLEDFWGWKDPRTTLFLNFWSKLLPNAFFILIYRSPWEVIDSLYRRGDDIFYKNPNFAMRIWRNYNQAILEFYNQFSNRCILLNVSSIIQDPSFVVRAVKEKFGITLEAPAPDICDKSLLRTEVSSSHRPTLVKHYFPEAIELYRELNAKAVQFNGFYSPCCFEPTEYPPYQVWALQDWFEVRRLESDVAQLQTQLQEAESERKQLETKLQLKGEELAIALSHRQKYRAEVERSQTMLEQTQTELAHKQIHLEQTQTELAHKHTHLEQTQTELAHKHTHLEQTQTELAHKHTHLEQTQTELAHKQTMLEQTQTELAQLQTMLEQNQTELERSRITVAAMQTSKFWKLRSQWLKLKKALGLVKEVEETDGGLFLSESEASKF